MTGAARSRNGFASSVRSGLASYATLRGRATRSEFWWFQLFGVLADAVAGIVDDILGRATGVNNFAAVGTIVSLGLLLPTIAVTVRRLHDVNRAGWWYFLAFTIVGLIPLLIWLCSRGTPGANRYGLGTTADIAAVFGDAPTVAPSAFDRPHG